MTTDKITSFTAIGIPQKVFLAELIMLPTIFMKKFCWFEPVCMLKNYSGVTTSAKNALAVCKFLHKIILQVRLFFVVISFML
jgi:hypothetical protein